MPDRSYPELSKVARSEDGETDDCGDEHEEERVEGSLLVLPVDAVAGAEIAFDGHVPERSSVVLNGFQGAPRRTMLQEQ
jgi:hypothetical protein